jgi:hypothetical protein
VEVLGRRWLPAVVVTAGALVCFVGSFLPWLWSGSRSRSSYDVFDLTERLGFAPDGTVAWALRLWPLMPLLLVFSVVGWWWHRPGRRVLIATRTMTAVGASYALVCGLAVRRAPEVALFRQGVGTLVTIAGAAVMLIGLIVEMIVKRRGSGASAAS